MSVRRIASILPVLLGIACGASQRPRDVVVYASGTDLESANPLVTVHPLSRQVQRHVLLVTLVRYDSALRAQPYYARSWRWSPDRRVLDMRLASDLRWQDGTPTTSTDARYTLLAARDPRSGYARAADLLGVDSVAVLAPNELQIRFRDPPRELPAVLAELPILPAHVLARTPVTEMRRAPFNTSPIGNGPFRFVERVPGQHWTFARNPEFPAAMGGPPSIRQLVITVVDEPTTKFAGLASGDLDFAGIAPTMAALATRDPTIAVVDYPILFTTGLFMNAHRPPFDDARVRRAIDLSIDRKRIVDAALAGYGTPAVGPVPPENPLALRQSPRRDAKRADSLLDAAGWRRGAGRWRTRERPFTVELLTVGSGDNAVEQLVQADLAERGIKVEIRQLELAAFLTRARGRTKTYDMLVTGIPGDLSLAYLRALFESSQRGGSLDYSDFHDPALDALFARARAARTDIELHAAWMQAQQRLDSLAPVAWLYHSRGLQGVSARMRNVVMDLRGELVNVARWSTGSASAKSVARR